MNRLLALPGFLIGFILAVPLLIIPALLAGDDDDEGPTLDIDRLARARHATWPDCYPAVPWEQCGAVAHLWDAQHIAAAYRNDAG